MEGFKCVSPGHRLYTEPEDPSAIASAADGIVQMPSISNYIRDPFPNNIIPQSRIDPLSKKIGDLALSTFKPLRTDVVRARRSIGWRITGKSGTSVNRTIR